MSRRRRVGRALRKYLLVVPGLALLALALAVLALDSGIGHRVLADWLAGQVADNGLSLSVGRIEGSIFGGGRLDDVALRDADGVFLRVPEVTFAWAPLAWLDRRLVIEDVVARRGVWLRRPVLRPTLREGPLLPGFDVTIRHLAVQRLTVARAVFGGRGALPSAAGACGAAAGDAGHGPRARAAARETPAARPRRAGMAVTAGTVRGAACVPAAADRRIDLALAGEIRHRRAFVRLVSRLGGGDRLDGRLDADEAAGRFDLGLDYVAPRGGLLAGLTGAAVSRRVHLGGRGGWADWRGTLVAREGEAGAGGRRLATLGLGAHGGAYAMVGRVATAPLGPTPLAAALGPEVAIDARGVLADGEVRARARTRSATMATAWQGAIDLAAGRWQAMAGTIEAPGALGLGGGDHVDGVRLKLGLDGALAAPVITMQAAARRLTLGKVVLDGLAGTGTAAPAAGGRWRAPVRLTAARVTTGGAELDRRLVQVRGTATLTLGGGRIAAPDLVLGAPGIGLALTLAGDTAHGAYALTGRGRIADWVVAGLGSVGGAGPVAISFARGGDWHASARLAGGVQRLDSAALARLAGGPVALTAALRAGHGEPLWLPQVALRAPDLTLALTGQRGRDGVATYSGSGHQHSYGRFDLTGQIAGDGVHATLALDDPLPAAGIRDVRLAIAPAGGDYAITASGQSTLGPFAGDLTLALPAGAPARLDVRHLAVSETAVAGVLTLGEAGPAGTLTLGGGGVAGTVALAPRDGGEAIDLTLAAHDAHFGGAMPIAIANAQIDAHGRLARGHTSITAAVAAQGVGKGRLFVGQAAAQVRLVDGTGTLAASLAGRRGSRFALDLRADIAPGRLGVGARGTFAGQPIATPHRIVLSQIDAAAGGGWRMAPGEIDIGAGRAVMSGTLANGSGEVDLHLLDMPLALGDVVLPDLGLGGTMSGVVRYARPREALPTGEVQLILRGLTRSGLLVTSRPIDLAVVGRLDPATAELRAAATDQARVLGRVQARIADLPAAGDLGERLRAGRLAAAMRYGGPADVLWRLLALDAFDLSGPVAVAADVDGSIAAPRIRGSLAGTGLRLQSAVTGTDITRLAVNGAFAGSQLTLTSLAGETAGGGSATGSGSLDFAGLGAPKIDLRLAVRRAAVLSRADMAMTVTGPVRILSDGSAGTIAGRVTIDEARWRLGQSPAAAALPRIAVREINRRADIAPADSRAMPWRFLVDAAGGARIRVIGLGLDSEWGARLQLRGDLDNPVISGAADLVRGTYEFSGQDFTLTRGRITFAGESPPDPRLDIAATANVTGLSATVTVRGTSLQPEIAFTSVPPLPEEELLSRLLFGDSVAKISATEAIQLGTALASLHGGGGLDPINRVRSLVGLDRLRIVSADPTIPRQAGVALGKDIGHRIYAEVVTDGRQYSATNLEFRITRWLSLLASVSTVGRNGVNARVSHDY